jgi:hypothetical protein
MHTEDARMPSYGEPWDDKRLVSWLARSMGLQRTDFRLVSVWRLLQGDAELIRNARDDDEGGEGGRQDMLDVAKQYLAQYNLFAAEKVRADQRATQSSEAESGRTARNMSVDLSDGAARRATEVARSIACHAAARPMVTDYRNDLLGGGVLGPNDVDAFAASLASWVLPRREFVSQQIPTPHGCRLVGVRIADGGETVLDLWVNPPGIRYDVTVIEEHPPRRLALRGVEREAWPESPVYELARVVDALAGSYPWEWEEAAWFVLTGEVPEVLPLRAGLRLLQDTEGDDKPGYRRGVVRLDVEPWVPVKDVTKAYRRAQQAMQPRQERALDQHSLDVFRWVEDRRAAGDTRSLRALQRDTPTGWTWKQGNGLAVLYGRVRRQLMAPDVRIEEPADEQSS